MVVNRFGYRLILTNIIIVFRTSTFFKKIKFVAENFPRVYDWPIWKIYSLDKSWDLQDKLNILIN